MIFVCFVPLLIFRDFTPNNELKYLSIVDEAIRNHTVFTFYNHGTPYADKPPLYFWCIRFAKWLAGDHYMFLIGLFSLIPALLILHIMDKWTATYLPLSLRSSSQLMLITTGLFTGSAIVLRMDMLMCLFIVLSLYTFYKMYIGEKSPYDTIRLPAFIFLAILTKGPVGILVPFLSITLFLWYKKQIRTFGKYLGWKQWATLLFFFSLWLTGVYIEGGKEYLHNLIFHQTVHRAVNSFHHQAVKAPGSLRVCALAPDGVIEAVEDASLPFFLGVQWHPERMYRSDRAAAALFEGLVRAARGD